MYDRRILVSGDPSRSGLFPDTGNPLASVNCKSFIVQAREFILSRRIVYDAFTQVDQVLRLTCKFFHPPSMRD